MHFRQLNFRPSTFAKFTLFCRIINPQFFFQTLWSKRLQWICCILNSISSSIELEIVLQILEFEEYFTILYRFFFHVKYKLKIRFIFVNHAQNYHLIDLMRFVCVCLCFWTGAKTKDPMKGKLRRMLSLYTAISLHERPKLT